MKIKITILFLIITTIGHAQIAQFFKGKIIDKESKAPLVGANIILLNSNSAIGAVTDLDGYFKIVVPVGRISLKVTYVGYEDALIPEMEIIAGKEIFLNIEMRENVSNLQEVVVKAKVDKAKSLNSMATISARMISSEDANRYAAGYSDPARMVSSFAGVASTEGDKNDIVIRGNSPRGLQWKLEGIEIPSPNHFTDGQGDTGGSFCIISSNTLANSDFYTGAFPAEYGNALAGILDLNLRKGNPDKHEFAFQAGVVGAEASLEGPIFNSNGSSYLINYRYANFQLLNRLGLIDMGKNRRAPIFQDLTFNFVLPTKNYGTFSLFGTGGMSTTGKYGITDSMQWKSNSDLKTDELENHQMGVIGAKHMLTFANKKTFLKTIIAATTQYDKWDKGYLIPKSNSWWYPGKFNGDYSRVKETYNIFSYPSLQLNSTLNHKINASNTIRAGVVLNVLNFKMFSENYNYDSSYVTKQLIYDLQVDRNGTSCFTETFVQWKHRINDQFEFNTGAHYLLFLLNKHYSIEPRFGLKWEINEKSAISYGFGIHSRIESISAYYSLLKKPDGTYYMPNKNVDFTRSIHNVVGYDWSISADIRLKLEAYYQYLFNVPIRDSYNSTESAINAQFGIPDTVYSNNGKGYNKGIELTLEKFYSNDYYMLITGSIYDSKYRAGDGKLYNTYFNGNYLTNILGGKDFKLGENKQNIFGVNCKVLVKGGFRFTPIDLSKSGDNPYYIYTESFSKQAPFLLRFDLGLKYRRNYQGYSWIISLDVQNLTDRKNVLAYSYNHNKSQKWLEPQYGLGRILILNFRIEF